MKWTGCVLERRRFGRTRGVSRLQASSSSAMSKTETATCMIRQSWVTQAVVEGTRGRRRKWVRRHIPRRFCEVYLRPRPPDVLFKQVGRFGEWFPDDLMMAGRLHSPVGLDRRRGGGAAPCLHVAAAAAVMPWLCFDRHKTPLVPGLQRDSIAVPLGSCLQY